MKKILFLVAAILFVPVNANAHAGLVSANPAADSVVSEMPSVITLTFTEDLMVLEGKDVNSLSLNLLDGVEIPLSGIKVDGAILSANIPTGDFQSGAYEIFYSIISADGHKLSDSYSFSLNAPVVTSAPASEDGGGDGVLPLPIVGAIAIVVLLGGLFAFQARSRKG